MAYTTFICGIKSILSVCNVYVHVWILNWGRHFTDTELELSVLTSGSWVTGLYHEVLDDPVELHSIVIASSRQFSKISTCVWGMFPVQLTYDVAHSARKQLAKLQSDAWIKRQSPALIFF